MGAKKDPSAPKRGQSAYFLWLNANRPNIKKDGMGVTDVAKKAGELWRAMSPQDKQPWEGKAREDKERYEREMEAYNAGK